jgi:exosortase/archaeosortase family protein
MAQPDPHGVRLMRQDRALLLVAAACWDGWRLLAARLDQGSSLLLVLLLAAGFWRAFRAGPVDVPTRRLALCLLGYAAAAVTGPALLQIASAAAAMAWVASCSFDRSRPRLPMVGGVLLALPILPTMDFLLAYPLRRISAVITTGLLQLNGISVDVRGVALDWHGRLLLFDGPCSGVRMLWASLMLATLVSVAGRFGTARYGCALLLATASAVVGNAVRAASLFYLEVEAFQPAAGPWVHEAVGLLSFILVGGAMVAATHRTWRVA